MMFSKDKLCPRSHVLKVLELGLEPRTADFEEQFSNSPRCDAGSLIPVVGRTVPDNPTRGNAGGAQRIPETQ